MVLSNEYLHVIRKCRCRARPSPAGFRIPCCRNFAQVRSRAQQRRNERVAHTAQTSQTPREKARGRVDACGRRHGRPARPRGGARAAAGARTRGRFGRARPPKIQTRSARVDPAAHCNAGLGRTGARSFGASSIALTNADRTIVCVGRVCGRHIDVFTCIGTAFMQQRKAILSNICPTTPSPLAPLPSCPMLFIWSAI